MMFVVVSIRDLFIYFASFLRLNFMNMEKCNAVCFMPWCIYRLELQHILYLFPLHGRLDSFGFQVPDKY